MDYNTLVKNITETILEVVKKAINTEGHYDYTFTGQIESKESETKGTVSYNGLTYTVSSTLAFNVGDIVRVCAPQNN
jgi:hypothetical protein